MELLGSHQTVNDAALAQLLAGAVALLAGVVHSGIALLAACRAFAIVMHQLHLLAALVFGTHPFAHLSRNATLFVLKEKVKLQLIKGFGAGGE